MSTIHVECECKRRCQMSISNIEFQCRMCQCPICQCRICKFERQNRLMTMLNINVKFVKVEFVISDVNVERQCRISILNVNVEC